MDLQTALMIFIAIFALAIGFFLGLFLISLDAPFLKKLFPKEEPEESTESVDPESTTPAEEGPPAIPKPTPDSELILRVWKEEGKPPVYEVDGDYLEKEALPQEILNYLTVPEEIVEEPEPVPPPEVEEEPVPETVLEIDEDDEDDVKMLSVVDEVNDILQRKLHGSPMAGKGIHLMENHNKEIRFWVGLESYNDVSEIPDPDVRKLINDAVKEWEQKRG
jgi:hypothetical protein